MKGFLVVCGVLASLICLVAGLYLLALRAAGESSMLEAIAHGLGIYFIAKAFFVGPVLLGIASKVKEGESIDLGFGNSLSNLPSSISNMLGGKKQEAKEGNKMPSFKPGHSKPTPLTCSTCSKNLESYQVYKKGDAIYCYDCYQKAS